jgi:hypothetical protein
VNSLTARDRREIKARIAKLEGEVEDLEWAIDDAAEADDGERWEDLNDQLEYRQGNIDELRELLEGGGV